MAFIDDGISASREAMIRLIKDDCRAESGLLDAVHSIKQGSREGVMALASGSLAPSDMQLAAIEAVWRAHAGECARAQARTEPCFSIRERDVLARCAGTEADPVPSRECGWLLADRQLWGESWQKRPFGRARFQ